MNGIVEPVPALPFKCPFCVSTNYLCLILPNYPLVEGYIVPHKLVCKNCKLKIDLSKREAKYGELALAWDCECCGEQQIVPFPEGNFPENVKCDSCEERFLVKID